MPGQNNTSATSVVQALDGLRREIAEMRAQHAAESQALKEEITGLRKNVGNWDEIVKKLKASRIAELLTRHDLKEHPFYAFRNLVASRIKHMAEAQAKLPPGAENECFVYGSKLDFLGKGGPHPIRNETVDGLRLGLENGLNFRLSLLSPLFDVRDTEEIRRFRSAASTTLQFLLAVKEEATKKDWRGGFLVSAAPFMISDSFSSIKVGCDRRVSVLAASTYEKVTEYIFDESPIDPKSLASDLRAFYYAAYDKQTFPLLTHQWEEMPQALVSVRVVVFHNKSSLLLDPAAKENTWYAWEFPWEDVVREEDIPTYKMHHCLDAPKHLTKAGSLADIVFAGKSRGRTGKIHIVFIARRPISHDTEGDILVNTDALPGLVPADILPSIKRYAEVLPS
jgi:hypothetical protein